MGLGKISAATAALIMVGSGTLAPWRPSVQTAVGGAVYGAPPVVLADWQFPDGVGAQSISAVDQAVRAPMSDGLTMLDNTLTLQPDLATELPSLRNGGVKVVKGNLVVTWRLKPQQRWADGSALTSAQAIFALKMSMTPQGGFPAGSDAIHSLSAPDPRTIVITYRGLYGGYLYAAPGFYNYAPEARKYGLGDVSAYAPSAYDRASWLKTVLSVPDDESSPALATYTASPFARLVTAMSADPLTTSDNAVWNGPYRLGEFTPDQRVTLVPNLYYNALPPAHDQNGRLLPRPARLEFVAVAPNPTLYAYTLRTGATQVNQAGDFQVSDLSLLYGIPRFHVSVQSSLEVEHLELNQRNPYLADVRVRRALALAIDKTRMVQTLFPQIRNPADFVATTFYPANHPYVDRSVKNVYDLAQARALLSAAGYETDLAKAGRHVTISLDTTAREPRYAVAETLRSSWALIGVVVRINRPRPTQSYSGLFARWEQNGALARGTFDVALFSWTVSADPDVSGFFDPKAIPTDVRHGPNQINYSRIDDALLTNAFTRGAGDLDPVTRNKFYDQAQERVADQAYWIPLFSRQNISVDDGTILNYKPNPGSSGNTWNAWQWGHSAP